MVQEAYATHPAIRDACAAEILGHVATIEADIAAAMAARGRRRRLHAGEPAHHTQAVLQGAFVLAKATGGAEIAVECVDHLRRYVLLLFAPSALSGSPKPAAGREAMARQRRSR